MSYDLNGLFPNTIPNRMLSEERKHMNHEYLHVHNKEATNIAFHEDSLQAHFDHLILNNHGAC